MFFEKIHFVKLGWRLNLCKIVLYLSHTGMYLFVHIHVNLPNKSGEGLENNRTLDNCMFDRCERMNDF